MKSYDKAAWHIDGGEDEIEVISRFKEVFEFLSEKKMLTEEGLETMEFGMDSSVSLNSSMVTEDGEKFLDCYYDQVLEEHPEDMGKFFHILYLEFMEKAK